MCDCAFNAILNCYTLLLCYFFVLSLISQWVSWLLILITAETADRKPQIAEPISANSKCCRDRLRLRLLSAAAERITASFRILHVCATDGLTLTAAADVTSLHKLTFESVRPSLNSRDYSTVNQNNKENVLKTFPPVVQCKPNYQMTFLP